MTAYRIKLAVGVGTLLLLWLLDRRDATPRVKKELEIDANVNSPTFGEPLN